MGREVRMVPADWEHPKVSGPRGEHFQPMFDRSYLASMAEWRENKRKWDARECGNEEHYDKYTFEEWEGRAPDPLYYMPDWQAEDRTHFMMYEDTSEGTPMSPAFETKEELARWLVDNKASSFGISRFASYEWWLKCIEGTVFTGMMMTVSSEGTTVEISGNVEPL